MKYVTQAVYNTITSDYHNVVGTTVHAEWQMNKFYRTVADNTPSEDSSGFDVELFPIESITKSTQPNKSGIVKGIVDQMYVADDYYTDAPGVRFYTADVDDEYKYWRSPNSSGTDGTMTNCAPQVLYVEEDNDISGNPVPKGISVNKIYFVVENSYSYPTSYNVQIQTSAGGAWTTIASNTAIPRTGKVEYWYNGSSWTTTPDYTHNITIYGVRMVVNNMYVPTSSHTVTGDTVAGVSVLKVPGGQLTQADVGSVVTATGSVFQTNTTILNVDTLAFTQRRFILNDGSTVTATSRPSNAKLEIDPIVTYYTYAQLSNPIISNNTGITVTVTGTPVGTYFSLISLGGALELDLSPDVTNWSDDFTMGEPDFISPLGKISSNNGSVVLFNDAGTYSNTNASSKLYGLLDRGVIFRIWVKYGSDSVQELEMYSDTWNEQDDSVTVNLIDASTLFMSIKPRPVLYQNMSVQEIIWRICDIIGFNNYEVNHLDTDPQSIINIFWTDGTKTAWEIFSDLSRATQTAVYFDSYGVLQIVTRGAAWDDTKPTVYDFNRTTTPGGNPANIVTLTEDNNYEANQVTITWKPTDFKQKIDNVTPYDVVWEPDGVELLRSTPLAANLLASDTTVTFPLVKGRTWPWNGMANVEGEFISFDAKWYQWYDANGVRQSGWVENYDEQKKLDIATPAALKHLNSYTGKLRIKQRGLWNTQVSDHFVGKYPQTDSNGFRVWTKARKKNYGATVTECTGMKYNIGDESSVQLQSAPKASTDDYTYFYHGRTVDQGYWYLGSRFRIDKTSHKDKLGGFFFNADGGLGTGYFIEIKPTINIPKEGKNYRQEVLFYSMKADGSKKNFGGQKYVVQNKSAGKPKIVNDVGSDAPVLAGRYIDIDVRLIIPAGTNPDHHIQIYCNGVFAFEAVITQASGWQHSRVGLCGLFARGQSSVSFDNFYAINNLGIDPVDTTVDNASYFDRIDNGYYGNQMFKDWAYQERTITRRVKKKNQKIQQLYNQRFFDEFGAQAHEIREFDITFKDSMPVLESFLYLSNRSQVACSEFTSNSSKAKFVLANMSHYDAVLSGDDELTAQGNGTITQKLMVYGRPATQQEEQTIVKTDDWAIRRRGTIDVEYSSDWIQNEDEANAFADWLTTHWSHSDSTLTVEVFGNPMLELTDTVTVSYRHINAVFYVIGIANSFEGGLSTQLTLRKAHDQ